MISITHELMLSYSLATASAGAGEIALMVLIGLIAGLLGGLLGIGGGLVMIPALTFLFGDALFGINSFHLYKLAALTTAVLLSIPAVVRHAQAGAIVRRMIVGMIVFGVVGVLCGTALARVLTYEYTIILKRTFGAFMLLTVAAGVLNERFGGSGEHGSDRCPMPFRWGKIGMIVGFPSGIVAGLLGVGGGVWAVPSQNYLLGVKLRNAIANSACMIIGLSFWSSVMHCVYIHDLHDTEASVVLGFWLTLWLAPGAVVGGWFGAKLTHTLPVGLIRKVFYILLAATGYRLLVG